MDVSLVDSKDLDIGLGDEVPAVPGRVVLQRCVSYFRNVHSTAALEAAGYRVVNNFRSAWTCGNKLFGSLELLKSGLPTPKTRLAFTKESAARAVGSLGYPVVLKPVTGSWGRMAALLKDRESASAILEDREYMFPLYQVYYLQEFVRRPPRDIRTFVVGGETIAAIYRTSVQGEWRTNTARGGKAEACAVSPELGELSVKAAEATGGEVVGVDLMESEDGLLVHEVNNTTEFKNTVPATGVDIPGRIVDYLVSAQAR